MKIELTGVRGMKIELTGVRGTLLVISSAAIAAFRMLFPVTMHPEIAFGDLADAFYIPKASLEANPSEKGCFRLGKIIPADGFLCMGMILSRKNNPCRKILPNRDEFTLRK